MTGKEIAETFGTLHWQLDFAAFCRILDLNPTHNYTKNHWLDFQAMCRGISLFDAESLDKLINAYNERRADGQIQKSNCHPS